MAESCDVVLTMLPNSPQVKEVVLGENGIIKGHRRGKALIDIARRSTSLRDIAIALSKRRTCWIFPVAGEEKASQRGSWLAAVRRHSASKTILGDGRQRDTGR